MTYQGVRVRAVPVTSVFAYERAASGYRLVKSRGGAYAALYDDILASETALCEVGTGVSVSQSLKPSAQGAGLLYQADCKLLDLKVSGNKGQLFDRLQGYVDGTVHPKKRRRL